MMTRPFGIQGSTTSHGGIVMASQSRITQMGISFLRVSDGFTCPKCNMWSTLIKSHDHVIMDGKAVAYVGDHFSCGGNPNAKASSCGWSSSAYYTCLSATKKKPIFKYPKFRRESYSCRRTWTKVP